MTKHEYHIALVLIALVTAGILGYHLLNGGSINDGPNCTLSTYISNGYNCGGQGGGAVSQTEFIDGIEQSFSESRISLFDFRGRRRALSMNETEQDSTLDKESEHQPDTAINTGTERFLISESHLNFIRRLYE